MPNFSSPYNHDLNRETKHDYHIMLHPSIKSEVEETARAHQLSVSAYIERALLHELQSDK